MLDAKTIMKQAGDTAHDWMLEATRFVEERFAEYPPAARATLIAAYIKTAAGDELAMNVRGLAEDVMETLDRCMGDLTAAIEGLQDSLRSDHPLQGETLEGVTGALTAIADSIAQRGEAGGG